MRRAAFLTCAALAAALAAGCGSIVTRQPDRYFVLEAGVPPAAAASRSAVHVAPTTTGSFYDTRSMVYSRAPGTRAYYQFNHWTERPHRTVHELLVARLEATRLDGAPVLDTHVEEIYHDAVEPPGTARITIDARLVDPATRAVFAQRRFTRSAPAASYDAQGAVQGMRQALGAALDDIVAWVATEVPAKAARAPR